MQAALENEVKPVTEIIVINEEGGYFIGRGCDEKVSSSGC